MTQKTIEKARYVLCMCIAIIFSHKNAIQPPGIVVWIIVVAFLAHNYTQFIIIDQRKKPGRSICLSRFHSLVHFLYCMFGVVQFTYILPSIFVVVAVVVGSVLHLYSLSRNEECLLNSSFPHKFQQYS